MRRVLRRAAPTLGWALLWAVVCWTVFWWGLSYPSFWDPDEAHYAQTTREMLAAGDWLVPLYDGKPFFDKPILFHLFQLVAFTTLGPTEFAARTVSAGSAMALLAVLIWFGRTFGGREVARTSALMLAVLPATFALSAYAILDMTFTLFLFGAAASLVTAALTGRSRLQYVGYVLLGLAVLTKGPLALVLAGTSFLLALWLAPTMRPALLGLRWGRGLVIAVALSAPWFVAMWVRFGSAFVDGYALRENLWLYTRPLYGNQPSYLFYLRVTVVGLLPWTPLLIGRIYDAARGRPLEPIDRLLWAWTLAIVGFFSFSRFKLDHYVYPAAPALCLLAARAWVGVRRERGGHAGVVAGGAVSAVLLVAAGIVIAVAIARAPIELSPWAGLLPLSLACSGLAWLVQIVRGATTPARALPASVVVPVLGLVGAYAVLVHIGLPEFERAKPVRDLARLVARAAQPGDQVGMYRLNRWSNSWRFYVERPTVAIETPEDFQRFLARPGRHYCGMLRRDFDALAARGLPISVIHEADGLFTTTGRALSRGAARRTAFVVVSDAHHTSHGANPVVP
jgi:4-amino-4-deoxy-L-arabinose transferase-like glycosyltransferase